MKSAPSKIQNDFRFFDERLFTLAKIRWISLAAALFYPVWSVMCQWLVPGAYDSILMRMPIALMAMTTAYMTMRPTPDKYTHSLYHTWCFAMTGQVFYLVAMNNYAPMYMLGGFFIMFCAGPALLTLAALRNYFILFLTVSIAMCAVSFDANHVMLVVGSANAGVISYAGLRMMLLLIERLRQSKVEIEKQSQARDDMLNSLGQGFLSFDPKGVVAPEFSRACVDILEEKPGDREVWDVLRIPESDREDLKQLLPRAFSSRHEFGLFIDFFPKTFPSATGKSINLEYRPSLDNTGNLTQIVVVATDNTDLVRAEAEADHERKNSQMIASIVKDKRMFGVFFQDMRRDLRKFAELKIKAGQEQEWALEFKRFLHSAKGATGMFWMEAIAARVHELESEWKNDFKPADIGKVIQRQAETLAIDLESFTETHRDVLGTAILNERAVEIPLSGFSGIVSSPHFRASPPPLQEEFLSLTLQPIVNYMGAYSALVTKTAEQQMKQVHPVEFINGDLPIFPEPYSGLFSNFVHIFRNAIDHGLEFPAERQAAGKDSSGQLVVEFKRVSDGRNWIVIEVRDDGRGIDPARIRAKLAQLGQSERAQKLSDEEVVNVIFEPEFSTRDSVTDLSGRGIGLNALLISAQSLGGRVAVESVIGKGTTFRVTVPDISAREVLPSLQATRAA